MLFTEVIIILIVVDFFYLIYLAAFSFAADVSEKYVNRAERRVVFYDNKTIFKLLDTAMLMLKPCNCSVTIVISQSIV